MSSLRRHATLRCASGWLAGLALLGAAKDVSAWGSSGHRTVALVAQARLTPAAHIGVNALLALEPGATLESVSTWADKARQEGSARWHYVNLPRDGACRYVATRDCPNGDCAVAAIESQVRHLATDTLATDRLRALKYVVHLIGDLHQPLHAGHADDRGGNAYPLQVAGATTHLHALWDAGFEHVSAAMLAQRLLAAPAPGWTEVSAPADWAHESCAIHADPAFYPGHEAFDDYAARQVGVARRRMHLAGLRLATVLNRVFR